jgi:hypothetical protein
VRSLGVLILSLIGCVLGFLLLFGAFRGGRPAIDGAGPLLPAGSDKVVHINVRDERTPRRRPVSLPPVRRHGSTASVRGYGGSAQALAGLLR